MPSPAPQAHARRHVPQASAAPVEATWRPPPAPRPNSLIAADLGLGRVEDSPLLTALCDDTTALGQAASWATEGSFARQANDVDGAVSTAAEMVDRMPAAGFPVDAAQGARIAAFGDAVSSVAVAADAGLRAREVACAEDPETRRELAFEHAGAAAGSSVCAAIGGAVGGALGAAAGIETGPGALFTSVAGAVAGAAIAATICEGIGADAGGAIHDLLFAPEADATRRSPAGR